MTLPPMLTAQSCEFGRPLPTVIELNPNSGHHLLRTMSTPRIPLPLSDLSVDDV